MWCTQNHLQLSATDTKEINVDLKRTRKPVTPVLIQGVKVDTVKDNKYLRVHIDNELDRVKKKNCYSTLQEGSELSLFPEAAVIF